MDNLRPKRNIFHYTDDDLEEFRAQIPFFIGGPWNHERSERVKELVIHLVNAKKIKLYTVLLHFLTANEYRRIIIDMIILWGYQSATSG